MRTRITPTASTVEPNIRRIAEVGACDVGYSFVALSRQESRGGQCVSNVGEIYEAACLARSLGCRYLEVKSELTPDHHLESWSSQFSSELASELDRCDRLVSETFEVLVSQSLLDYFTTESAQPKSYVTCAVTRLRTLITPTGMYPCAYHRGKERFRLADLSESSLRDAWIGADLSLVDPSVDCDFHCSRHGQNVWIHGGDESVERGGKPDFFL